MRLGLGTILVAMAVAGCQLSLQVPTPPTDKPVATESVKPKGSTKPASATPAPPTPDPLTDPATVGAACTVNEPAATPDLAPPSLGRYAGQPLPNGWSFAYKTEAEVTAALASAQAQGNNWACLNKLFAGALTVYYKVRGGQTGPLPTPDRPRPNLTAPPNDPATLGAACTAVAPAAQPDTGTPQQGAYQNQLLPNGYATAFASEEGVSGALARLDGGANWACMNKFFPGALTVYGKLKAAGRVPPPTGPTTPPKIDPQDPGTLAAACTAVAPAREPDTGAPYLGAYAQQRLPAGFNEQFQSEAEVTAQLKTLAVGPEWPCFNKFYPGATQIYRTRNPVDGPAACTAQKGDEDKDNGVRALGSYENQYLPKGWNLAYQSEADVTAAIDKIYGTPDWNCFQKFFPGATTIYKKRTAKP